MDVFAAGVLQLYIEEHVYVAHVERGTCAERRRLYGMGATLCGGAE